MNSQIRQCIHSFDASYKVTYVRFFCASQLADAMLLLTVENEQQERRTFSFGSPEFLQDCKALFSVQGLNMMQREGKSPRSAGIEIANMSDGQILFTAKRVRDITPCPIQKR